MDSKNDKVNAFLEDIQSLSSEQFETVMQIRTLFLSVNAELEEDIKYGGLVFMLSGELLGGIYCYKSHLSIEFSHGADLTDADKRLEGKGKLRRHLKIESTEDIETKNAQYYIQQAVAL